MINKQDIQIHTKFSDGQNTLKEMIEEAIKIEVDSIIISDHAKGWFSQNGKEIQFFSNNMEYKDYLNQIESAEKIYNDRIKVFSGLEIEIDIYGDFKLDKGIIDYLKINPLNKKLGVEILIGSIHSESFEEDCLKFDIKDKDKRQYLIQNICNLIKNKSLDVFAHPFQALHGHFSNNLTKKESELIIETFISEWNTGHNIFLELNGKKYPNYEQWEYNKYENEEIELNDLNFIINYKDAGGKFVLGSDAHSVEGLTETNFSIIDEANVKQDNIYIFQ
jgi:DNA polymerase (family 10)